MITLVSRLVFLLLSLTACVPLFYKYHYISLEDNPNLRVVEHGKPSMYSGTRTFLFDDINIPVRYELVRDAYTVYFEIDAREAYIRAKDHAGTPLSIQSPDYSHIDPMKRCHLFRKPLPDARMPADEKVKGYAWFFHREHCTNSDNSILTFQVLDEDGIMVGEEALSMKKKQGGITWHWDAF